MGFFLILHGLRMGAGGSDPQPPASGEVDDNEIGLQLEL